MSLAGIIKFAVPGTRNQLTSVVNNTLRLFVRMASKTSKPKVYVTREINPESLEVLKKTCEVDIWSGPGPVPRDELLKNVAGKQALFCMLTDKVDKEILDVGEYLKVIATMSVGYDHLDVKEIQDRQIKIGYTPGILSDATAELTLALLLATSRRLFESNTEARTGGWAAWAPFWMCGHGLAGSTVGIVGFGSIGQEVARRISGFKPKRIIFVNRSPRTKEAKCLGATKVELPVLLAESDFVIATCALTPETQNLFNADAFEQMKPTSVFINTSRGGVVDQEALVCALQKKTIWGAGLDVMQPEPLPVDHPLLKLDNCVILPHIGSATITTRNAMAMMSVENIIRGLNNERMPAELK